MEGLGPAAHSRAAFTYRLMAAAESGPGRGSARRPVRRLGEHMDLVDLADRAASNTGPVSRRT